MIIFILVHQISEVSGPDPTYSSGINLDCIQLSVRRIVCTDTGSIGRNIIEAACGAASGADLDDGPIIDGQSRICICTLLRIGDAGNVGADVRF